jgi:hypothetical protein
MICGVEGFWSFIMCGLICQPIAQFMPGQEGNGIREDTVDTFQQIKNNLSLLAIVFVSWFLGLTYNCVSTALIGRTSAVIRTLMEAFRTFLLWMVQFMIFYSFDSSSDPEVKKFEMGGEEWADGSYVQLGGFILMIFSLFTYNAIPRYPCFNYGLVHVKGEGGEELEFHNLTEGEGTPGDNADKRLRIVSEIETNKDNSVTPAPDAAGEDSGGDEDDSVRSMSVDEEWD